MQKIKWKFATCSHMEKKEKKEERKGGRAGGSERGKEEGRAIYIEREIDSFILY